MLLAVAVVLNMSFAELPMPLGARVPNGAFGRSSSRARRALLMRSRLLDGERGHEEFVHVGLCHAWVQVPRRRHHTALLGQQ